MPEKISPVSKKTPEVKPKAKTTKEKITEKKSDVESAVLELETLKAEAKQLEKEGKKEDYVVTVLQPKIKALEKSLSEGTKRKKLEVLKKKAKDLEISGRGESEVLNTLEPEIYALETELAGGEAVVVGKKEEGEIVTPEIAAEGMKTVEIDSKLDNTEAITAHEEIPVVSMEDKIAKLDAHIKNNNLSGKSTEELQKIVEAGLSSSKDQKEIARELDAQEIKSLRESILKAKGEAVRLNQDATLDWYEGNYDKAKASQDKAKLIEDALGIKSNVEIQKAEKAPVATEMTATESMSLKHGKEKVAKAQMMYLLEKDRLKNLGRTGKRFDEELSVYKKKYIYPMFEVKAAQPAQKAEKVNSTNTEKLKQIGETNLVRIEQKTKPMSDVERYGQETLNEVSKIRTEEMKRLVDLKLERETILTRMEDFEKTRINPILKSQDKTTATPSYESVADMTKKKDQEKKKNSFWSKFKSIFE